LDRLIIVSVGVIEVALAFVSGAAAEVSIGTFRFD
jgi:hypothetical protein